MQRAECSAQARAARLTHIYCETEHNEHRARWARPSRRIMPAELSAWRTIKHLTSGAKTTMACPITVVILTKNEEALIARCMASVAWADEILVLDSGSTDRTRALAAEFGASVYEQSWLGWVPQRQAAIEHARNDWVMIVEADEIVTPELRDGVIAAMAAKTDPHDGYVVDRRDEFFGRLFPNMKRAALRRTFVRLFNRQYSHYAPNDLIHERVIYPGREIALPGTLLHWRSFTIADQMSRFVSNSLLEADMMAKDGKRAGAGRILLMPMLRFLWCYVYCAGFRLGTAGLVQAMMMASSEFMRNAVLWERQSVERRIHPPESVWRMPLRTEAERSRPVKAGQA